MHAFVCSPFSRKITVPYLHFGNVSICNCAACMSSSNWRRASDSQKMKILLSSPRTVASCNFEPYFLLGVVCSPRCKSQTHRFKGTREHAISSQALAQVTSAIQLCNRKYGREMPRYSTLFFSISAVPPRRKESGSCLALPGTSAGRGPDLAGSREPSPNKRKGEAFANPHLQLPPNRRAEAADSGVFAKCATSSKTRAPSPPSSLRESPRPGNVELFFSIVSVFPFADEKRAKYSRLNISVTRQDLKQQSHR